MKKEKMFESNCVHSADKIHEDHARHATSNALSVPFTNNVHQVCGRCIMKCTYTLDSCREHPESSVGMHALMYMCGYMNIQLPTIACTIDYN